MADSVRELLDDLAFDNPRPSERWFSREHWDPMHSMNSIRTASRRGLIELSEVDGGFQFRFTPKGREALEKDTA